MNTSTASNSLSTAVEDSLRRLGAPGQRICVGLSGGMDSVVLLELLARLSATLGLRLSAIHVHHGLSPNADQWMAFCESVCNAKSIPLMIDRVRVDRALAGGVEAIARDVRYSAFNRVDADLLALAQHADDQAETVMLQILRGTGLKGMAGMGETRTLRDGLILIRPLLGFPRTAIEAYADRNRLKWIEDESNRDTVHTRNFIRQVLAPKLAERFPHYRESLARAGRHASEADEMLSALAAIDLQWDGRNACADALDGLPLTRQVNALYHWLQWLQWPGDPSNIFPSQAQLVEWAMQLFRPAPPDRPHQAAGHDLVIYRRKNLLQLERK